MINRAWADITLIWSTVRGSGTVPGSTTKIIVSDHSVRQYRGATRISGIVGITRLRHLFASIHGAIG
jgi:hypothetical protein